jgi:hypothetical protein
MPKRKRSPRKFSVPPSLEILIVSPKGAIKTLYYGRNVCPWQLHIRRTDSGLKITLSEEAKEEGWEFLEALYRKEGRAEAWDKYYAWWDGVAHQGKRWPAPPDSALPREVLRRRETVATPETYDWTEPTKPAGKATKKARHDNVSSARLRYALCE